jgi:polysaccharide export outer membrane protein
MSATRTSRLIALWLAVSILAAPFGCRNPGQSTLPPEAVAPPGTALPPLPRGDLYADETTLSPDAPIDAGDTLEVTIHRGAGEEKYSAVVRETGSVLLSFLSVDVRGLTASQAEARIQQEAVRYMRNPVVQVVLKKKSPKLKRIFVFGDVKKPGQFPLARNMTVLNAVAAAENYNETALLEEIRVIRGGNLQKPQILSADLARLFTYGDWSRNLSLEENDIIYVPRERLGDAAETARKLQPIVFIAITPLYFAYIIPTFAPSITR